MSSYALMKSVSTGSVSDTYSHRSQSYLELKVLQAVNLSRLMEDFESLHPYIFISQKDKEWESKVAEDVEDRFVWGEIFELDLNFSKPFKILLCDRDEYGSDTVLCGFVVLPQFLRTLTTDKIWLKLDTGKDTPSVLIPNFICKENYNNPMLQIQVKLVDPSIEANYRVKFLKHKNLVGKNSYTSYEVLVRKSNGAKWKVRVRFSQVSQLRKLILAVMPWARELSFPHKTYLHWLSGFSKNLSKFSTQRIKQRKEMMEKFINFVLKDFDVINSSYLNSLLNI